MDDDGIDLVSQSLSQYLETFSGSYHAPVVFMLLDHKIVPLWFSLVSSNK